MMESGRGLHGRHKMVKRPLILHIVASLMSCVQRLLKVSRNIGITHVFFHALTFARIQGSCLNTRPLGRVFKHLPRDLASVNALKQTCLIVILAYFT